MRASFWLGILAGIFGILGAIIAILLGSIGSAFSVATMSGLYYNAIGAVAFSTLGMLGGIPLKRTSINAAIMIIAAVGVFVSEFVLGILPAVLFVTGAVLLLTGADDIGEKRKKLGFDRTSSPKGQIPVRRTLNFDRGRRTKPRIPKPKKTLTRRDTVFEDDLIFFLSLVAGISIAIASILYALDSGIISF